MNVAVFCTLALTTIGANTRGYVLEFSSQSCGPCQQVAPVVAMLEREGLPIRSVDVEQDRNLANQYQVQTIPTFILVVDGQEVERVHGPRPESEIRQLLAKIPTQDRGDRTDRLPVVLGESAPLPRPEVDIVKEPRYSAADRDDEAGDDAKSKNPFWPFPKSNKKSKGNSNASVDVRGNSPDRTKRDNQALSQSPATGDPLGASVRIRLLTGNSIVRGSGTIIESTRGVATILTCSHICRDATEDTKVEVDFFRDGEPITILGAIIGTDPDADVGLLSVSTDEIWPTCPVAAVEETPSIGTPVSSIGCGNGADPSREQLRVTELNKYNGPDTVICSGIPVQGRSGGGLFNQAGKLVGVCFAADADPKTRKPNGGVYCGLRPIYALLTKHELQRLVPADEISAPANYGLAENTGDAPAAAWADTSNTVSSEVPEREHEASAEESGPDQDATFSKGPQQQARPTAKQPSVETITLDELQTSDAEVMVVIRRRDGGKNQNKVIMIHQPSRKFLAFVEGESLSGEQPESTTSHHTTKPQQSETPTRRIVRVKPSAKLLLPTGMKTRIRTSTNQ